MDDKKRTYDGLAYEGITVDDDGDVLALFSSPDDWGDALAPATEKCLHELSLKNRKSLENNILPDDIAYRFLEDIELYDTARKMVQEFKAAHNFAQETPSVDLSKLPKLEDFNPAANQERYDTKPVQKTAKIYEFPCLSNNT